MPRNSLILARLVHHRQCKQQFLLSDLVSGEVSQLARNGGWSTDRHRRWRHTGDNGCHRCGLDGNRPARHLRLAGRLGRVQSECHRVGDGHVHRRVAARSSSPSTSPTTAKRSRLSRIVSPGRRPVLRSATSLEMASAPMPRPSAICCARPAGPARSRPEPERAPGTKARHSGS